VATTRRYRVATIGLLAITAIIAWLVIGRWLATSLPDPAARFAHWRVEHTREVAAYRAFLDHEHVGAIVPEAQLLRLGRRWRLCGGEEFVAPPREQWPQIVPTLRLLADLRARALLRDSQVASSFRTSTYNRCEGGSTGSRHLSNQALDLDVPSIRPSGIAQLCDLWRKEGPQRHWGLGFYTSTEIHLDTAGFRTWGSDFHADTSLCLARR
jgi:hypothetical protein